MKTQQQNNVLIVDDDPMILLLLEDCLTGLGCRVAKASDGRQAVGALEKDTFPLVISDINMPKMNGAQLLAHVNEYHQGTDVIIITGDDDEGILVDLIQAGAYDYLQKPFGPIELEAKLRRFLREKNLLSELNKKENLYRTLIEASPT